MLASKVSNVSLLLSTPFLVGYVTTGSEILGAIAAILVVVSASTIASSMITLSYDEGDQGTSNEMRTVSGAL